VEGAGHPVTVCDEIHKITSQIVTCPHISCSILRLTGIAGFAVKDYGIKPGCR